MIKDDTKQTLKFLGWVLGILVILYLAAIMIFYAAGRTKQDNYQRIDQLAKTKSPIRQINTHYHLSRGTTSYAVKGTDRDDENYYFIYLPASKKAYLLAASAGVNQKQVETEFTQENQRQKITAVNLGWYKGQAAWEVAAKSSSGRLTYSLYEFKTGKEISEVANL